MLETKLLAGRSGYDVVVVSGHFLERLVPAGAFRKLDLQQLPSHGNLDAELMAKFAQYDPGNAHAIGYTWGTVGIGFDESALRELAPNAPTDSWSLVYDPATVQRLSPCGVSVVDSPSDVIGTVLAWSGHDANRPTPEQLQSTERTLLAIRPHRGNTLTDRNVLRYCGCRVRNPLLRDHLPQPGSSAQGGRCRCSRQDQDKLFTTVTRYHFPGPGGRALHDISQLLQHHVSCGMAVAVVVAFEIVHIKQYYRELGTTATGPVNLLLQYAVYQTPVAQPG